MLVRSNVMKMLSQGWGHLLLYGLFGWRWFGLNCLLVIVQKIVLDHPMFTRFDLILEEYGGCQN
jgi:hypothetical protein